jgi:Protein of unknown function (DUF4058)
MARHFPGIDPYIEARHYWPDFHLRAINYLSDAIADRLPDAYDVRVEERINLVEYPAEDTSLRRPDLVIERAPGFSTIDRGPMLLLELEVEPTTIPFALLEEVRETYLEIIHRAEQTLVSAVELLSPENKTGSGFAKYLAKRNSLLQGPVHLVELDFLIGGHRMPMRRPLPPGDAYAFVARGDRRPDCEVYAWSIRQALTTIRIPLLAPDPDIPLDLAAVYATTFEKGRYARRLKYDEPLTIGLSPEDRAWAESRAKGLDR